MRFTFDYLSSTREISYQKFYSNYRINIFQSFVSLSKTSLLEACKIWNQVKHFLLLFSVTYVYLIMPTFVCPLLAKLNVYFCGRNILATVV